MKNLPLFILGLIVFTACTEAIEKSSEADSYFKATLKGEPWIASPEIILNSTADTITIMGIGMEEVLYFRLKITGNGEYELNGEQAMYYTTVGQDAKTSEYILNPNQLSSVSITKFNSNHLEVEGKFNIYLQKEWPNTAENLEIFNFTNGTFKGEINTLKQLISYWH